MKYLFLLVVTTFFNMGISLFAGVSSLDTGNEPAFPQENPEQKIAKYLKFHLSSLTDAEVLDNMKLHYVNLGLIDSAGNWATERMASASAQLLPENVSVKSLEDLIDEIAECAEKNPYLHDFLIEAEKSNPTEFYQKVIATQSSIPYLATYAMSLNNFTKAAHDNVTIFEDACNVWNKPGIIGTLNKYGALCSIKYYSVREAAKTVINNTINGAADPNTARFLLPLNILEIAFYELINGNTDNAKVGWDLAMTPPGGKYDPKTGSGPATISEDGKTCQLYHPFPKAWTDLYQAWDMAFVLTVDNPLYLIKLLIPEVSRYQEHPEQYMHKRVLALFPTINCNAEKIRWHDTQILQIFGASNARSAEHYRSLFPSADTGRVFPKLVRALRRAIL